MKMVLRTCGTLDEIKHVLNTLANDQLKLNDRGSIDGAKYDYYFVNSDDLDSCERIIDRNLPVISPEK